MKKTLFPLAMAAMLLGMASCGGNNPAESSSNQSSTQSASASKAEEEKIVLSAAETTVKVGETLKITSSVKDVSFESRDTSIATVDASGVVTGVKAGTVKIQARKTGYKVGSIDITVVKADARVADFYLEFEDATHYDPDGFWGFNWGGMVMGPGDTPVEETDQAHGGKSIGWFTEGCKETIYFTSDKDGKVDMDFMMAYNADMDISSLLKISVNGVALNLSGKVVSGPEDGDTNNYYDFNPISFTGIDVKKGENTIVVEALGQGPNLDCVQVYTKELQIAQVVKEAAKPVSLGKVDYFVEGFEFGPAITGVLAHFNGQVVREDLANFTVKTNGISRTINKVYFTDEFGAEINATSGTHVRFDLEVKYVSTMQVWGDWAFPSTDDGGCSPFVYANNVNNWNPNIKIAVGIEAGKSVKVGEETYNDEKPGTVEEIGARIIPSTADWGDPKSHTADGKTLTYKAYETSALANDGVANPLVIWLHGMGEGGTDPDIALLGNDVTNLGESKVQSHFVKDQQAGAYVLAVQTPTMWMDRGTGDNNGGVGHSVYTTALKSTIDKYIADNGDIDSSRIFVGGCSNGGYMTMEMAITYPDFFRAYYPVCEAYSDSFVTDADIAKLKGLSIWFTHAANDTTVDPTAFTIPTYQRLIEAGATDVHLSLFENVVGNEGNDHNEYQGHYSWIYVLKDEVLKDQADPASISVPSSRDVLVGGSPVSLWGWMAAK